MAPIRVPHQTALITLLPTYTQVNHAPEHAPADHALLARTMHRPGSRTSSYMHRTSPLQTQRRCPSSVPRGASGGSGGSPLRTAARVDKAALRWHVFSKTPGLDHCYLCSTSWIAMSADMHGRCRCRCRQIRCVLNPKQERVPVIAAPLALCPNPYRCAWTHVPRPVQGGDGSRPEVGRLFRICKHMPACIQANDNCESGSHCLFSLWQSSKRGSGKARALLAGSRQGEGTQMLGSRRRVPTRMTDWRRCLLALPASALASTKPGTRQP